MSRDLWRVGTKVPINVYEGNRPVTQCHNETDAMLIVEAVNGYDARINSLVLAEQQRRADVTAELNRQIGVLIRQRDALLVELGRQTRECCNDD